MLKQVLLGSSNSWSNVERRDANISPTEVKEASREPLECFTLVTRRCPETVQVNYSLAARKKKSCH